MAIAYYDPTSGDDTSGTGSATAPYKTLNKASTAAGTGGEVRCLGKQLVPLGNAQWTNGSTAVVFAGVDLTGTLGAGTYIRPTPSSLNAATCPAYRVTSSTYSGGNTTATLTRTFRGPSGTVAAEKIPLHTALAAHETTAAAEQTLSFGWKSDETQPADYVSAFCGAYYILSLGHGKITVCAEGRLFRLDDGTGYGSIVGSTATNTRITGVFDYCGNGAAVTFSGAGCLEVGTVLSSQGALPTVTSDFRRQTYVQAIYAHNGVGAVQAKESMAVVGYVEERGCGTGKVSTDRGRLVIGKYVIADNSSNITLGTAYAGDSLDIGEFTPGTGTYTYQWNVNIGGPAAYYRKQNGGGLTDLVTGRAGGSDLARRHNPNNTCFPLSWEFTVPAVASGATVALSFSAYYSGTAGSAPTCWIDLLEPNGLTVASYPFSPPRGSSWADASRQTITFGGTTRQAGSLRLALRIRDNSAADALLYTDDMVVTLDGKTELATLDTGAGNYLGLGESLVKTSAGGMLLPEGGVQL